MISYLKDGTRERLALLVELYGKLTIACIKPNTKTLTNSLKLATAIPKHASAMEVCRDIFTELKAAGVKPSLTSYYYALIIFYKKGKSGIFIQFPNAIQFFNKKTFSFILAAEAGAPPNALLREIMTELEARPELKLEDASDTSFFPTAMEVAANSLQDPILADRIHKCLLSNNNYKLIGDGFKENLYYRYYLLIHVKNNSLDEFMKSYYDLIVPHVYTPEPYIMSEMFQAVSANDPAIGTPLLPRLWTHLVQFNYLERKDLVSKGLQLMTTHCVPPKDSPVHQMYAEAAWTVWKFVMVIVLFYFNVRNLSFDLSDGYLCI